MKALLYKDACVLWKQMKFMLVIIAVFCLLPNSFGLNAFFVVYAGLMLPVSLMAYDERAHWDSFAAMLPYPPRALVLSRYAAGWLLTLLAGVLYLVGALIQDRGRPGDCPWAPWGGCWRWCSCARPSSSPSSSGWGPSRGGCT